MHHRALAVVLLLALAACHGGAVTRPGVPVEGFDHAAVGAPPAGWRIATTGGGVPLATWQVQADPRAASAPQALALTAINHDSQDAFNLCWTAASPFGDGWLSVAVRADSGEIDQGGGLAWRIQDADNYYVCRFNPLEANYRVYVVTRGVRRQLGSARVAADGRQWCRLEVEHTGEHIVCWLDGQKLLEVDDGTIASPGGVGFWTKADARTSFDDFAVDGAGQ